MGNNFRIVALVLFCVSFCQGSSIGVPLPIDHITWLNSMYRRFIADGLVFAGTIVEGGPVFGRSRMILGGNPVHPGLEHTTFGFKIDRCPDTTFGYTCESWVPQECEVNRHLFQGDKLCICKVNVCK
ncbi:hypothetical protein DPMN_016124 [Dreissena polymorpha]|uniref:Uncharacterized protein n=1 Tax=Dreissena polymorpha TaxID=45954 RepID=A0A9D4NCJ9_DREPO|nr:hypothetical protein DPMN_016124 [Dreissena polymorpha]